MTPTEEDLAIVRSCTGDKKDIVAIAKEEVENLCAEFRRLSSSLHDAMMSDSGETALLNSRQRLMTACMDAADKVHSVQRSWFLRGVDVYVAHTRNGSPIRVDKVSKCNIIGFDE